MVQIIGTLGAFVIFCIVFFFLRIAGVEWTMNQSIQNCAIYLVISLVLLAAYIGYTVYRKKHPKEEEVAPEEPKDPDEYDFRPKSK